MFRSTSVNPSKQPVVDFVCFAALLIGLAVGCGQAVQATSTNTALHAKKHERRYAASSPTTTPADLVKSIEAGFAKNDVVSVTFGDPPPEYQKQTSGPWMYVEVTQVDGASGVLPTWEAKLLAAAYYHSAQAAGLTRETGFYIFDTPSCLTGVDDNSCDASGGPIGDNNVIPEGAKSPVPFDPTAASAATVTGSISSSLQNAGLNVTSITIDSIDGHPVPVVIAESADPTAFVDKNPTDASLFGSEPNDFEGIYFELDNSSGNPVLERSFASRIGAGVSWSELGIATSEP
jgi:hypothetical protein